MILGDSSANVRRGDSLASHRWAKEFPELAVTLRSNAYTCVITNPPFGKDLQVSVSDARAAGLTICRTPQKTDDTYTFDGARYQAREVGLAFLERCHDVLVVGGRLGIVLPETYFFSSRYRWLQDWLAPRYLLRGMFNIAMEAFQGFCRAKTNFYVFEKVAADAA